MCRNFMALWPLFMDRVQLPPGYRATMRIFFPLSSKKLLVLIISTSDG